MVQSHSENAVASPAERQHPAPASPPPVRGFLIDIDGVLYIENQLIPGAVESIAYLQQEKIPFLLATNTTRRSRYTLLNNLKRMGIKVSLEQIYSAPYAAACWLTEKKAESICLMLRGDTHREFKDFRIANGKPQYLLIGDLGEDLTYSRLNQAFRMVMSGAKMVALQKNRYWQRKDGLSIDTGAIVAALEYATRKKSVVIGKPSPAFYQQAARLLKTPKGNIAMIGDDWEADIKGSLKAGLQAIAVQTGKLANGVTGSAKRSPAFILDSIADLPGWIKHHSR